MKRFKLLDGFHLGPNPDNFDKNGQVRPEIAERAKQNPAVLDKMYERGDIIMSPGDLTFLNVPGYRPKFEFVPERGELLPSGAHAFDPSKETIERFAERMKALTISPGDAAIQPPPPPQAGLNDMNVEQLRRYAEEEEINVGNAKTREQLLAAIKGRK
jgi:hypothetical protein